MNKYAIASEGLSKDFLTYHKEPGLKGSIKSFFARQSQRKPAVIDFNLEIKPGEIIGLLGPNGAGKTTLMKMFTGIIVPSNGTLKVVNHIPHKRDITFRKKIALVMGQKSQLWWDIPAMDSFLLLQRYYEIEHTAFKQRLSDLSDLLGVSQLMNVHVRKLSLGERMKMEIMASLLHQPEIVFLDEPTIGLDLVAQKNIRNFILNWQKQYGTTVILTSHYMADVAALCRRIVLLLEGKKRFDGDIKAFESVLGRQKYVSVNFETAVNPELPLWQNLDPTWNDSFSQVDLRIPETSLREISIEILKEFPVIEFSMEKLPIERVMNELLTNPHLIPEH